MIVVAVNICQADVIRVIALRISGANFRIFVPPSGMECEHDSRVGYFSVKSRRLRRIAHLVCAFSV